MKRKLRSLRCPAPGPFPLNEFQVYGSTVLVKGPKRVTKKGKIKRAKTQADHQKTRISEKVSDIL